MIIPDTNVVLEPLKPIPDANVVRWLSRQAPQTLFLSAITQAELLAGFEKMPAGRRREALGIALNSQVIASFEGRILAFDSKCATHFAKLLVAANAQGNSISFPDAAIGAIAISKGYQLATRNVRDFIRSGVNSINPWIASD
jgi:toxin FitB